MASDLFVKSYAEALFQIARAEETLDRVEEELTRPEQIFGVKC